jgi:hypothetical protein
MKFGDEAIKSRATRRSNSTWSSSESAGYPAGKVEWRLVMIGVRLPEEGGLSTQYFRRRLSAICWPGLIPAQTPAARLQR